MQEVINESQFNGKVKDVDGRVLVEFFATWRPHCKAQQPITDAAAEQLKGKVAVYQVDVDESPVLAREYAPDGFPTYVLFDDGNAIANHVGECPLEDVIALAETK